jgi:hypothetical protein
LCIETSDDPFVFIRSYYRCSTEGCSVKKRVERDRDDPSYVVTTYEGVQNHMSAGTVSYASRTPRLVPSSSPRCIIPGALK